MVFSVSLTIYAMTLQQEWRSFPVQKRISYSSTPTKAVQCVLGLDGFSVVIDGSFGPNTEGAVEAFQDRYDLDVDGSCGPETWGQMYSVMDYSLHDSLYNNNLYFTILPISGSDAAASYNFRRSSTTWYYKGNLVIKSGF